MALLLKVSYGIPVVILEKYPLLPARFRTSAIDWQHQHTLLIPSNYHAWVVTWPNLRLEVNSTLNYFPQRHCDLNDESIISFIVGVVP